MPRAKTESTEAAETAASLEEVPAWQRRSIERSLTGARQRAHARSDRFVAAALELLGGDHGGDFTVQDVVDRSDMSIRTFYSYFDGKDSLLLAAYETLMSKQVVPMLRERSAKQTDPVRRLHAAIDGLFEITLRDRQVARGLSGFYYRLAETRPRDLTHALEPLHGFITELVGDIADDGALRTDLSSAAVVSLLQDMLLTSAHSAVFAEKRTTTTDELWAFCSAAVLAPTAAPASRPSKR